MKGNFIRCSWILILIVFHLAYLPSTSSKVSYIINTKGCRIRRLDPFDKESMSKLKKGFYKRCKDDEELTEIKIDYKTRMYTVSVNERKANKYYGKIECSYSNVLRVNESNVAYGKPIKFDKSINIPKTADQICVMCKTFFKKVYENCYAFIQVKKNPEKKPSNKVNVLIIGIDSIARNNFIRTMSSTWAYLRSNKMWYDFQGYNRVSILADHSERDYYNFVII